MTRTVVSLLTAFLLATPALASDDDQGNGASSSRAKANARKSGVVREVTRGFFLRTGAGAMAYFGPLDPGTSLNLTFGQDFIDKEKASAAWEVFFHQGLHNAQGPTPTLQGDVHTFSLGAAFEYSAYVGRRFGVGARAGGGLAIVPLLINETTFDTELLPVFGGPIPIHNGPTGMFFVGPTFEYYTKLSHFSVGADVSFMMVLGLDLGVDTQGYVKYTF